MAITFRRGKVHKAEPSAGPGSALNARGLAPSHMGCSLIFAVTGLGFSR